MPNMARCMPSGNGGVIRWPLTKWVSPTRIALWRPGSASSGRGIRSFLELKNMAMPTIRLFAEKLPMMLGSPDGVAPGDLGQPAQGVAQSGVARRGPRGAADRIADGDLRGPRLSDLQRRPRRPARRGRA